MSVLSFPEAPCFFEVEVHDEDLQRYCGHGHMLCRKCGRHTTEEPHPTIPDGLSAVCPVHGSVAWSAP